MAAANFGSTVFNRYYTVGMNDDEQDFIQDDICNIMEGLAARLDDAYTADEKCVIYTPVSFGDTSLDLHCELVVKYGYYQGAYFDLKTVSFGGTDLDDINELDSNDLRDILYFQYDQNEGISSMHAKTLQKRLEAAYNSMLEDVSGYLEDHTDKLVCLGHFSNGEAVYRQVS